MLIYTKKTHGEGIITNLSISKGFYLVNQISQNVINSKLQCLKLFFIPNSNTSSLSILNSSISKSS